MSEYILLLRGGKSTSEEDSAEQRNKALQSYRDWATKLQNENRLVDVAKLDNGGRRLLKKSGNIQIDGPFTETKETIGGFYIVSAESQREIEQIARECPIFKEGGYVEICEIQT